MNNKRVAFILDHKFSHYRVAFFQQLSEFGYKIDIYHKGSYLVCFKNNDVNQIIVKSTTPLNKLIYLDLPSLDSYSIVVHMQNIRIINLWLNTLNPFKKYKLIHWGIGASSANGLSLNKTTTSRIRSFLTRFSSALVLYSDYPLPLFSKSLHKKIFIANNTIYNKNFQDLSLEVKSSFLFIGSLNKRKGLGELLFSFKEVIRCTQNSNLKLEIIGEGEEDESLKQLAFDLNIENQVSFLGNISSRSEKEIYFKKAYACISPKQAGLSVLESFSYGVPFISYKGAISGGEHLNIINGYNGFLVDNKEELTHKLIELLENTELAKKLGHNAYNYYKEKRQMKHMVNFFHKAFEFVQSK